MAKRAYDKVSQQQMFQDMLDKVIKGIDIEESTEWESKTRAVSENIREALVKQMETLRTQCDNKFLDYCNTVKSLLAIYNFGNLDYDKETDSDDESEWLTYDKQLIKEGISAIIGHVGKYGYDLSPYVEPEESSDIFALKDGDKPEITLSVTTVFTTLVYFRRAVKRQKIYEENELETVDGNLMRKVEQTVSDIFVKFVRYIEQNQYTGWGFAFNSRSVRLSDTYAVVDAISRFDDACNKNDELKRDQEFIDAVNKIALENYSEEAILDRCLNSMYKAAYNVYDSAKKYYGRSVFYASAVRGENDYGQLAFSKTDEEQISNSNRSSALFNPLYVAMITMYGYNDKEIVIRRFMDDFKLVRKYYNEFEVELSQKRAELEQKGINVVTLSDYAKKLDGFAEHTEITFEEEVKILLKENHKKMSDDYSDNREWRRYYRIARVFQKYLETQQPERRMEIDQYRDYLNATNDAIDQVQILYRNFENNQRLSIVDTDYVMFSSLDINATPEGISKLNKANISVNNLRPMLLSSKIMIVNALTKYPQAGIEDLYNTIIESQYRKNGSNGDKDKAWLWNADCVDMNSTARHCEAITYDYFDYYERYELGLKAINNLKGNIGEAVSKAFDKETDQLSIKKVMSEDAMISFKYAVLDIARQNNELIRTKYQSKLKDQEQEIERLKAEKAKLEEEQQKEIDAFATSREIGDTVRRWIREETDRHLTEMLSMIILNMINCRKSVQSFTLDKLIGEDGQTEVYSAGFRNAEELVEQIKSEYAKDRQTACDKYDAAFRKAIEMQRLFNGALDGIMDLFGFRDLKNNDKMQKAYNERKQKRKTDQEFAPYTPKEDKDEN